MWLSFMKVRQVAVTSCVLSLCVSLIGCASVKSAVDSTTTIVKDFDSDSIVCAFKYCPGYDEYKKAKQLFQDANYQSALENIEISVSKDPQNEKYLKEKQNIIVTIQTEIFVKKSNESELIPKEDLDKRETILSELREIATIIESNSGSSQLSKVNGELETIQSEKKRIGDLTVGINNAFSISDYEQGLNLFVQIKPYRGYIIRTSSTYPAIDGYAAALNEWLDKEYKQGNYEKVIRFMNIIDDVAETDHISRSRRTYVSQFYCDKGSQYRSMNKNALALLYLALAKRYKQDSVDNATYDSLFNKLRDNNETLYIEVRTADKDDTKLEELEKAIFEQVKSKYASYFKRRDADRDDASVAIQISIESIGKKIEESQPQSKFSKYLSGYNRVPNDKYYQAQQTMQTAQMELNRVSMQPTYGWADAIAKGLAQGTWQAIITKSQQVMRSDEAYDQNPIYVDYKYTQQDVLINYTLQLTYKIVDLQRKVILKEDTLKEQENKTISLFDGIHPSDTNNLKNTERYDENKRKDDFAAYIDTTFKKVAVVISDGMTNLFEERTKDYLKIGETCDAINNFITGYILKNGKLTESVYDILPNDFGVDLHTVSMVSSLTQKMAQRKNPLMTVIKNEVNARNTTATESVDNGEKWAVVIGVSKYADNKIPSLRYAAIDAKYFYDWLISGKGGGYAPSRVRLLTNKDATSSSMKTALFNWLGQALEEDMVMIYFAGHGSPQSPDYPNNLFLLPYDARYDDVASTGFPMWDIETAIKRFIKAKRVVIIADACHAGGVGQSFDIARRGNRGVAVNPINAGLHDLTKSGDGVAVISASDEKQMSQESKNWGGGHGVFTYLLVKGLDGQADYNKDDRVTLGELIPYLSEQVRRETKNAQSPTVAGKFDPALSIAK